MRSIRRGWIGEWSTATSDGDPFAGLTRLRLDGGEAMGSEERQRRDQIKVRVSDDEKKIIQEKAKAFGYQSSTAALLRDLALGIEPKSTLDQQAVLDLLKVNADLGRLGGLLKHWLQAKGAKPSEVIEIRSLMDDLVQTQKLLRKKVLSL